MQPKWNEKQTMPVLVAKKVPCCHESATNRPLGKQRKAPACKPSVFGKKSHSMSDILGCPGPPWDGPSVPQIAQLNLQWPSASAQSAKLQKIHRETSIGHD